MITKKNLKILIYIAIAVFLIGGFSVYQFQKFQEEKIQLMPGWKIYQNEAQKYSMQYPEDWSISRERGNYGIELSNVVLASDDYKEKVSEIYQQIIDKGEDPFILPQYVIAAGTELSLTITKVPSGLWCAATLEEEVLECTWKNWANRGTDYPVGNHINEEFSILQGREVFKRELEYEGGTFMMMSFPDPEEKRLFESIFRTTTKEKEENFEILEKIFSSFKFLK